MISTVSDVLSDLRRAVQDGLRNSSSRAEHIRWQTVLQHIETLEPPGPRQDQPQQQQAESLR